MKPEDQNNAPVLSPELKADHTWYNSLFTQLLAPVVATRYFWLAIEDINPFNFLRKPPLGDKEIDKLRAASRIKDPALFKELESLKLPVGMHDIERTKFPALFKHIDTLKAWKEPTFGRYLSGNFAALGMGATFLSIVGIYSKNTLHDIKSLYAEAVGYELNKKPEDVTLNDIFVKSRNEAVEVTRSAYTWRTLGRMATAAAFFVPWHKFRDFHYTRPKYDANANAGVGAIGAYLFAEGFLRRPSFFDVEQKLVSSKINHNDVNPYTAVLPQDVQSMLLLQRKHRNKRYEPPSGASVDGQNDKRLSERVAELFNQTYHNDASENVANFTIGKFNYLIGFGLLEHHPESLGFVELANRSTDMHEVKEAAQALSRGESAKEVFSRYGVEVASLQAERPPVLDAIPATRFADGVKPVQAKLALSNPRTHQDFATEKQDGTPGLV